MGEALDPKSGQRAKEFADEHIVVSNGAAAERVFSLLQTSFSDRQGTGLY